MCLSYIHSPVIHGRSLLVNSVVPKQEKTNLPVANETDWPESSQWIADSCHSKKTGTAVCSGQEDAKYLCSSLRMWTRLGYNYLQQKWVYPTCFHFFPWEAVLSLHGNAPSCPSHIVPMFWESCEGLTHGYGTLERATRQRMIQNKTALG